MFDVSVMLTLLFCAVALWMTVAGVATLILDDRARPTSCPGKEGDS